MVATFGVFAPRVYADTCLGNPTTCDGSALYRVHGFNGETIEVGLTERCNKYIGIHNNCTAPAT